MPTPTSLRFQIFDQFMVVVHGNSPPSDDEWSRMLVVRDANRERLRGILVVAPPRATISPDQRKDITKFLNETGSRIALMTDSALIRGIAVAVGFFGVKVKAYPIGDLASAVTFLGLDTGRFPTLERQVELMRREVGALN